MIDLKFNGHLKKSGVFRKSSAFLKQIPRLLVRYSSAVSDYQSDPPILANSFPKSGTHLLLQILEALPDTVNYGSFIASMPTITFRERSKSAHLRLIKNIVPGEVLPAHLFFSPIYQQELNNKNCVHYFIYRDLRDVAISDAYYLTYMNPYHRMHKYFSKKCKTMEERISTAILGVTEQDFPYDYPNIAKRFARYRGWLLCPEVLSIKYEELVSERRISVLRKMVEHYFNSSRKNFQFEEVLETAIENIDPFKSHTYRKGRVGGWRDAFTDLHRSQMKAVAGDLLVGLGFEEDFNW
jgi:hypothetical protein